MTGSLGGLWNNEGPRYTRTDISEDFSSYLGDVTFQLVPILPELSKAFTDFLLFGFFISNLLSINQSYHWSLLAGLFLYMVTVASHNFFHMKDNLRMYYFNFSLLSYKDWRISHALSHHQFANTLLDLEITLFEPIFHYLPKEDKNLVRRFLPWLLSPFVFTGLFYFEFIKRCFKVATREKAFHWDDYLGLTVPIFTWLLSGETFSRVFTAWSFAILSGSFSFSLVGLTAAHHHPEIYHEGDYLGHDKDFGILQLAAVRDRVEVNGNFFLTMITFGEHALHHMFPTVDHSKLVHLTPYLLETCKEFNIDFNLKTAGDLVTGMYQQLARNYLNSSLLIKKEKL